MKMSSSREPSTGRLRPNMSPELKADRQILRRRQRVEALHRRETDVAHAPQRVDASDAVRHVSIQQLRARVRSETLVRHEHLHRPGRSSSPETDAPNKLSRPGGPMRTIAADVEVAANETKRVARVDVVLKLHVVVVRADVRPPRDTLNVRIERVRRRATTRSRVDRDVPFASNVYGRPNN